MELSVHCSYCRWELIIRFLLFWFVLPSAGRSQPCSAVFWQLSERLSLQLCGSAFSLWRLLMKRVICGARVYDGYYLSGRKREMTPLWQCAEGDELWQILAFKRTPWPPHWVMLGIALLAGQPILLEILLINLLWTLLRINEVLIPWLYLLHHREIVAVLSTFSLLLFSFDT